MPQNVELNSRDYGMLFNSILQNIDEGILLIDNSLKIVFCNENAGKIVGFSPRQLIGQDIDCLKPLINLDATFVTDRANREIQTINDEEIDVSQSSLEIRPGCFFTFVVLRNMENFKEYQLNSFLQTPYEGIAVFDKNAHLLYANEVFRESFPTCSGHELIQTIDTLIPWTNLQQAIERGNTLSTDVLSPDGQALKMVFLPITRHNRNLGIIVKSNRVELNQTNEWEQLLEQYRQGTAKYTMNNIVGNNRHIRKQKALAARAARSISTVLIVGESGTGKEIFAHAIHNMSPRCQGPFIRVNCAAVPETLLESELFGYSGGAFTGALKEGKPGRFELANNGTIFLDEIADMSLSMQAKLLRVLQEKEVERIGSLGSIKVNIRIIAATNQDLTKLVKENKFREDLFYRLNVIVLNLLPLRQRADDIPLLSHHLLHRLNQELGTRIDRINPEVIQHFCSYDWPGNIRELENTIERAINFCEYNCIALNDIPDYIISSKKRSFSATDPMPSLDDILAQHEKKLIEEVLRNCRGNKSKAAKTLDIHRSVLYRKLEKYNIEL